MKLNCVGFSREDEHTGYPLVNTLISWSFVSGVQAAHQDVFTGRGNLAKIALCGCYKIERAEMFV